MRVLRWFAVALLVAWTMAMAPVASFGQTYDPEAPCGRDFRGLPMECVQEPNNIEAACLTQARVEVCLPYHQTSCQIRGMALACQAYQLGMNCMGGDPQLCQTYQTALVANRACALDNDQQACAFNNRLFGL